MAAKNERKPRPNASEKDEVAMMNKKAIMLALAQRNIVTLLRMKSHWVGVRATKLLMVRVHTAPQPFCDFTKNHLRAHFQQ